MKKSKKLMAALLSTVMVVSALTACGGGGAKTNSTKSAASTKSSATSTAKSSAATSTPATTDGGTKHIDVIAKGFQHQFWKAVELGTKKAAEEFGVEVTFQGPDNESAIAQQVEYLNTNSLQLSVLQLLILRPVSLQSSRLWKQIFLL